MSTKYAYGREQIVYVTEESAAAFGTLVQPVLTDAMKVLSAKFNVAQERKDRLEKGATRSLISRITGRKTCDWSIEKYVLPSGVLDTPSDDALLWEAMFGKEDISSGIVYSLLAEPAISLSLFNNVGPHREALGGAVPSKWTLNFGGGDEPKVTFSGEAKDHYFCGSDALAAQATASTTITVDDASQFAVGMLIDVGTENNTGAGFEITIIDFDTNIMTLDAAVTSQAVDAAVVPHVLAATTAGNIIPVTIGTVKLGAGADTLLLTACSFDIDQKAKMRNEEFGSYMASGFRHPEYREVTCSLTMYLRKGDVKWINDTKRFVPQDIEVILGDTEGSILQIDANQVEFDIPNMEVPDAEEASITMTGKCLGSAGEDEITATFL